MILELMFMFMLSSPIVSGESISDSLRMQLDSLIFMSHPKRSLVLSPLAVHLPLCKLASGAHGPLKDELLSALGYKSPTQLKTCYTTAEEYMDSLKDIDFIFFNKIFINFTSGVTPAFINDPVNYGTKAEEVGFNFPNSAAAFINRWIDTLTLKRINNVVDSKEINKDTSILFISGIYLKVTWEFPFDERLTRNMTFRNGNVRSIVPMMHRYDTYPYLDDPEAGVQFFNIKLITYGISMTFGIPRGKDGLPHLMSKLSTDPNYLVNVYKRMKVEPLKLRIPRFRIKTHIDFTTFLKQIGIKTAFNKSISGLDTIRRNKTLTQNIYLSKVKQKCIIRVDELGLYRGNIQDDFFRSQFRERVTKEVIADIPFYFSVNIQENFNDRFNLRQLLSGVYRGPENDWVVVN